MTKKTTMKHLQENGEVATRQTARPYTHVLLRKTDKMQALAAHEAELSARVAGIRKLAKMDFAYYAREAARMPVDAFVTGAQEALAKFGATEAEYVAGKVAAHMTWHTEMAAKILTWREEWHVISWHGNARPTPDRGWRSPGSSFKVEAINNGVRA